MKKNYKTKKTTRLLILLTIMSLMLFGCGSTQAESTTEPEKQEPEVVEEVETTVEETPTVQEEPETTEETEEVVENETPNTVDIWKTVEETDDICMVVLNDSKGSELSMNAKGIGGDKAVPYLITGEEKIYIPLRDNIKSVFLYYCDGSSDTTTLYSIDSIGVDYPIVDIDENLKVIEVEESQQKDYYIMINVEGASDYIYFLIGYDNR